MKNEEMFDLMNSTMVMHLATVEGDQPHVRGMLLFRADESGIVFHTGDFKDVFSQIEANPKAEVCFSKNGVQLRVKGTLVRDEDPELRKEIFAHPSRKFLKEWEKSGTQFNLIVYRMVHCEAKVWAMDKNFEKSEWVKITE